MVCDVFTARGTTYQVLTTPYPLPPIGKGCFLLGHHGTFTVCPNSPWHRAQWPVRP